MLGHRAVYHDGWRAVCPWPGPFTGTIHSVTVDVSGKLIDDPEAELRVHMARQ
jgi:hypothetical protein